MIGMATVHGEVRCCGHVGFMEDMVNSGFSRQKGGQKGEDRMLNVEMLLKKGG